MFDSPEFKRLQAEWYEKLAKDGFKDMESPGGHLRGVDPRTWQRALADRAQRECYFGKAALVLLNFNFTSGTERCIWQLHTEGISARQIAQRLQIPWATVKWKIKSVRMKAKI